MLQQIYCMDRHATTSIQVWMGMLQQVDMYVCMYGHAATSRHVCMYGHAATKRHVCMGMLQQVDMYGWACYNK